MGYWKLSSEKEPSLLSFAERKTYVMLWVNMGVHPPQNGGRFLRDILWMDEIHFAPFKSHGKPLFAGIYTKITIQGGS